MVEKLYQNKFAQLYDYYQKGVENDVNFYLNYFRNFNGKILEIGAGTGRITIPLLKKGIDVTAIDIAPKMLEVLKEKLEKDNLQARIICTDMRNFKMKEKFDAVIVTFRTFQHMYSVDDQKATLKNIKRHLKQKGILIFDVYAPKLKYIEGGDWQWREDDKEIAPLVKDKIKIFQRNKYDMAEQVMCQEYRVDYLNGKTDTTNFKMRFFFPFEVRHLLEMTGFEVKNLYGDFKKNKFTTNSPEMVWVAEKK